jgi:hypothetical protein
MVQGCESEIVGKFRSKRSGEVYLVRRTLADGALSCECLGWIHHGSCKHVAYVWSHPSMELTDIPTYQEAVAMDFGRNREAKEQWTIEHLKAVVL